MKNQKRKKCDILLIKLKCIENAKEFCKITSSSSYKDIDIDLKCGRYVIDAKSILGILSVDLMKEMKLVFHGEKNNEIRFKNEIQKFLIDE